MLGDNKSAPSYVLYKIVLPKTEVKLVLKNIFANEWFQTKTRIETSVKGNSETLVKRGIWEIVI